MAEDMGMADLPIPTEPIPLGQVSYQGAPDCPLAPPCPQLDCPPTGARPGQRICA